jgi:hypothetical protein
MQYEHEGMRLWVEPDQRLTDGVVRTGSDINLTLGVEPADASNKAYVRYSVNGGPAATIGAEPVKHVGNTQYFTAQLPCAALRDGDAVEYTAVCQCAARQVPSAVDASRSTSSFRMMSGAVGGAPESGTNYARRIEAPQAVSLIESRRTERIGRQGAQLKATHLSLFVLESATGHPIARMPFYAEVGVTSFLTPPQPECRLEEAIRFGLRNLASGDPNQKSYQRAAQTMVAPLCDAISRLLAPETIDRMAADPGYAESIISAIVRIAQELAGKNSNPKRPEALRNLLEDAVRGAVKEQKLPLAESTQQRIVWAHPIGVLATDHVGYLSFDLTRLPADVADALAVALEARRLNPDTRTDTSLWLYPMAREAGRFDALAQGRFSHDAIVVKLEMERPDLPPILENLGLLAMQNPDLSDWRLSPGSFASNPAALVGEDGCESVLPANVALQEFYFYQVVGITDAQDAVPPALRDRIRLGCVHEYRLAWYPLGHSLGQILYSMPLAPGESVNLAVIDWTRRDDAQRKEQTTMDEQLVHNEHRDRTIGETVNAAVHEYQHGSSFMAGIAGAVGGSYMGVAGGLAGSLGGSTSNSSGSREVAATTVQKLSDNITQASSATRELQSTVVVHSTEAEKEAIETRTVVNYNHSHALTILYYEVLRHFRVVTEVVRRRPAVLTNIHGSISHTVTLPGGARVPEITLPTIYENRKVLEAALLDGRYKEGFDIVERRRHRDRIAEVVGPPPPPPPAPPPQGPWFRFFTFEIRTGDVVPSDDEDVHISANIDLNAPPWFIKLNSGNRISPAGTFFEKGHLYSFVAKTDPPDMRAIPWGLIEAIALFIHLDNWDSDHDMSFSFLRVSGTDVDGVSTVLYEKDYVPSDHLIFDNDITMFLPTRRPAPLPPAPGRSAESIEEEAKFREFNEHLLNNLAHYDRALRLGSTSAQRGFELASVMVSGGTSLLEKVENRPLEVLGDFVAYPCVDVAWSDRIMTAIEAIDFPDVAAVERLVTLPTRGVFAEAKLAHCNASEEIDNTRFWDWQKSPIPHFAPEIAPTVPITPQPQQQNLAPTAFPSSIVNIVNPPNAPDPTGLAAAMNVLTTPNLFRDMSGRSEVADLLKKLSDNSVSIAEAANRAREIQSKYGENLGQAGFGGGAGPAPASQPAQAPPSQPAPAPTPEQREAQHLENQDKKGEIADKYLPPEQKKEVKQAIAQELKKPPPKVTKRTLEISLRGYGNQKIVGQWAWELFQRGESRGFSLMDQRPDGTIKIRFDDEFDDNRFRLNVTGEVLSGYGVNAQIKGENIDLVIPPELYKARDYHYVTLTATTSTFKAKASDSDEVTKKFAQEYKVTPELGYKDIIKVTGEGGWTWEKEGKKTAGHEIEMEVIFYTGGFTLSSVN